MGLFGGNTFNIDTDIPDLSGKIIFITGGLLYKPVSFEGACLLIYCQEILG